ncbi:hypothetical protein PR003_g2913 [Phytophthora rubi]|uniref:Reverse transcriptase Ty1/copia-type domain-containing protein n=1 Tax=Phytophthora rubi TaxID=129364 RepID=A0A6A4FZ60_9STRA|nr:hypothetical protein PR003_g2913 [Phytophthora rubi]
MAALSQELADSVEASGDVQKSTLPDFHKHLAHLSYDSVERLAKEPSSGIQLTDHKRMNGLMCAEGKQSKNRRSEKDTDTYSSIDRSNYYSVFLARAKDAAAKLFEHFLVYFKKKFDCKIHTLRTESGGEYDNVDLFCKRTAVTRQRYREYLPKDRVVATTHHGKNIERLDKEQNLQVLRLSLRDETFQDAETTESKAQASVTEVASARSKKKQKDGGVTNEAAQPQELARDIVNSATEHDRKTDRAIMRSKLKDKWLVAMAKEMQALETTGSAKSRASPRKWEFGADVLRCQRSVKRIFVLARKWRVPAKHDDVPNAFSKAEKEAELDIFLRLPCGMVIPEDVRERLGVTNDSELVLELLKALYGLKQADQL